MSTKTTLSSYTIRRSQPLRLRGAAGFSIIELMVVIGIIMLLVAILLPTIGRARSEAKATQCSSNLHQLYVASSAWSADHQPDKLPAVGWMVQTLPYVQDRSIYQCPGSEVPQGALDVAASSTSNSNAAANSNTTPPASNLPPLGNAFVRINAGGTIWDVPVTEGPWFRKTQMSANTYDLWLEDMGFQGGGDMDFLDVGLGVTDNGDGTTTLTLLGRPPGKGSAYGSSVMASTPSGDQTLMADLYKSGAQAGATTKVGSPSQSSNGNNSSNSSGSGSGTFTPGNAVASDYAFNVASDVVYGKAVKVYALDYIWSVADPATDNWSQSKWIAGAAAPSPRLVFARHMWQANVLYADGSVSLTPVSPTYVNPGFNTNTADLWQK